MRFSHSVCIRTFFIKIIESTNEYCPPFQIYPIFQDPLPPLVAAPLRGTSKSSPIVNVPYTVWISIRNSLIKSGVQKIREEPNRPPHTQPYFQAVLHPSSLKPYIPCTLKSNFIINSPQIPAFFIVKSSFKFQKLHQWIGSHSPPDKHHHPKILQIPMQNIVVCKCAKYQGNPANISKGIPTFNI